MASGIQVSIKTKSGRSIGTSLKKMQKLIIVESGKSFFEDGKLLENVSETLAPILTGTLRKSGFVDIPKLTKNTTEVSVGFGDKQVNPISGRQTREYALDQHEKLHYVHPRGGMAKYLTIPFTGMKKQIVKNLIRRVDKVIRIRF